MTSPEMQLPLTEAGQNTLTITIGDRNIVVPRKELYGIPDIGNAVGSDNSRYIRGKLLKARKNNPDINLQYLAIGKGYSALFLPEKDFVLAVTMIIPTIKKGYLFKKNQEQKADAPTLLLQSIVDNKTIPEEAKQQINSLDPQEKVLFLEKTFAILSDPDPEYQNKRNAALEILRVMDLTSMNPKELEESYRDAVYYLSEGIIENYDPHGEIHALLEAGKIIAPFIEKGQRITQLWNRVAKTFTGSDLQKILADIAEVRQLVPRKPRRMRTKRVIISDDTVKLPSLS